MKTKQLLVKITSRYTLTSKGQKSSQNISKSISQSYYELEPEPGSDFNCVPGCENCGQFDCICWPDEEEPEDIDEEIDHD